MQLKIDSVFASRLVWVVFGVAAINALLFVCSAASPLIAKDSWHVLETFATKYYAHELSLSDFFAKREMSDHAQPIQKAIFLWNMRNFGLDFTIEALVGMLFAICGAFLCMFLVPRYSERHAAPHVGVAHVLCLASLPVAFFSLGATQVFTWSLVTLGFMLLPLALLYFHLCAKMLAHRGARWPVLLTGFSMAVALDNLAIIYVLGFLVVCAFVAATTREWKRCGEAALVASLGCMLYDIVLQPLLTPSGNGGTVATGGAEYLVMHWDQAWKALWYPMQILIAPPDKLDAIGGGLSAFAVFLTGLLLLLHVLFWWRCTRDVVRMKAPAIAAAAMAMAFYGLIAALCLTRVRFGGFEYLLQTRYYVGYLLGLLPILMYGASIFASKEQDKALAGDRLGMVYAWGVGLLSLGMCILQAPLSVASWESQKYISDYTRKAAFQYGRLSDAPEEMRVCADIVDICSYDVDRKKRIISLVERNHLNIFNQSFQMRHRLYPREEQAIAK